jgi:hypothetical protein
VRPECSYLYLVVHLNIHYEVSLCKIQVDATPTLFGVSRASRRHVMLELDFGTTIINELADQIGVPLGQTDAAITSSSLVDSDAIIDNFNIHNRFVNVVKECLEEGIPLTDAPTGIGELDHLKDMLLDPVRYLAVVRDRLGSDPDGSVSNVALDLAAIVQEVLDDSHFDAIPTTTISLKMTGCLIFLVGNTTNVRGKNTSREKAGNKGQAHDKLDFGEHFRVLDLLYMFWVFVDL